MTIARSPSFPFPFDACPEEPVSCAPPPATAPPPHLSIPNPGDILETSPSSDSKCRGGSSVNAQSGEGAYHTSLAGDLPLIPGTHIKVEGVCSQQQKPSDREA